MSTELSANPRRQATAPMAGFTDSGSPRTQSPDHVNAIGEEASATTPHPDPVAVLSGALSAVLGIAVLAGWHLQNPRLVQFYADSPLMAYNTAVSFVGLGLAVVAMGSGRRIAARLAAGVAGLLALAVLLEYMTGAPPAMETMLTRFALPKAAAIQAPMVPNTALAFVLIAGAVCLWSGVRESRRRLLGITIGASACTALGLNALAGYLTGIHTNAWGYFTAMLVHTSIGLVLLGVGVLAVSWREGRHAQREWHSWVLVVIAMAGAVTSISFWQALLLVGGSHLKSAVRLQSDLAVAVLIFGLLATALLVSAVLLAQAAHLRASLAERLRIQAEKETAERKLAEEALGKSERMYRTLLESLPQRISYKDRNSVFLSCNGNFARDMKIQPFEIAGKTDYDFFPKDMVERHHADDRRVMESGEVAEIEEEYAQDGQTLYVHTVKSPVRDEAGNVVGVILIFWDVSARKQAEAALALRTSDLERSNAELQQFAYVASHDLQEPLRMVTNFTQLLADRYSDKLDQNGREFIAYAVEGATRMQRLIVDLLALSRVGTRGTDFEMIQFDEALGLAVANLQFAIRESGAFVSHDELPTVMADSSRIVQLFQNLIGNAIKFKSDEPPRVHISACRNGNEWTFSVRDNGIGFKPKYGERIFSVFQRLHSREEYPGTGIGLAICRKIVERHHGRIWAESKPGSGSTFFFTTPAAGVPEKQSDELEAAT